MEEDLPASVAKHFTNIRRLAYLGIRLGRERSALVRLNVEVLNNQLSSHVLLISVDGVGECDLALMDGRHEHGVQQLRNKPFSLATYLLRHHNRLTFRPF